MPVIEDRSGVGWVVARRHRAAGRWCRVAGARSGGIEAMRAFHHPPGVVLAADSGRGVVDLLPAVLSDIGDVQVAGGGIEAGPPRIAKPVGPDLVAQSAETVGKRIA